MVVLQRFIDATQRAIAGIAQKIDFTFRRIVAIVKKSGDATAADHSSARSRMRSERKKRLESEIVQLEHELDGLLQRSIREADSSENGGPAKFEMRKTMAEIREVDKRLGIKKAELSRIRRQDARENRFRHAVSDRNHAGRSGARAEAEAEAGREQETQEEALLALAKEMYSRPEVTSSLTGAQRVALNEAIEGAFDSDPEIRRDAAMRLGELRVAETGKLLFRLVKDKDNDVSAAAIDSLALLGDDSFTPIFRWHVRSEDTNICLASLKGLALLGDSDDGLIILAYMQDDRCRVREAAATYLGWRREKAAIPILIRALREEEREEVRVSVLEALRNICDERAVRALIRALQDSSEAIRNKAKLALEQTIGQKIDVDTSADNRALAIEIDRIRAWWRVARVDRHLEPNLASTFFGDRKQEGLNVFTQDGQSERTTEIDHEQRQASMGAEGSGLFGAPSWAGEESASEVAFPNGLGSLGVSVMHGDYGKVDLDALDSDPMEDFDLDIAGIGKAELQPATLKAVPGLERFEQRAAKSKKTRSKKVSRKTRVEKRNRNRRVV